MAKFTKHVFSYSKDGAIWSIHVMATGEQDARVRLSKAALGRFEGDHAIEVSFSRRGSFSLLYLAIGLIAGNYVYQVLTAHNWQRAFEISFFQAIAVLACWLSCRKGRSA